MSEFTDQRYLVDDQYRDATNLNARIQLHVRFSTARYSWHRWVFDQIDLPQHSHVLELGTGPARLWLENMPRIPQGWEITLSDLSPGMVAEARHNLKAHARHFSFEQIDAQAIPFGDASFDAVIANHMLYHVPDRAQGLREIQRVLRPGGRFYASTVGQTHMREIGELVRRVDPAIDFWVGFPPNSFDLETGADELAPLFEQVSLRRFEDALVVTEAEPLLAYIQSMSRATVLQADQRRALAEFVERELATAGAIRITKDSGMFIANKEQQ